MDVHPFADPAAFYDRAAPFLMADEAAHILPLGIAGSLVRHPPDSAARPYLAVVEEGGAVVAAALMTPPHNLVLSRVADPAALDALVADLLDAGLRPPGVHAPAPTSQRFAARWCAATGQTNRHAMAQRIYALERVIPPAGVPGELRPVTAAERDLAVAWVIAFNAEAETAPDPAQAIRMVDRRMTDPADALSLWWHDGRPVALVGGAGPTPGGIRIGPVYTPPEQRRRGYASAATAALSQRLLDGGRRRCFLFADLANPTANRIYQAIGYRPVCDVDEYRFAPQTRLARPACDRGTELASIRDACP